MILKARYVIAVPSLKTSAQYYKDVLGFEIKEIGDEGWRNYEKDGVSIMAGECPDALPLKQIGDHSYFAYFILDEIDKYYDKVLLAGGKVLKKLRREPWGMAEFSVETIDGHRIMFGSSITDD